MKAVAYATSPQWVSLLLISGELPIPCMKPRPNRC